MIRVYRTSRTDNHRFSIAPRLSSMTSNRLATKRSRSLMTRPLRYLEIFQNDRYRILFFEFLSLFYHFEQIYFSRRRVAREERALRQSVLRATLYPIHLNREVPRCNNHPSQKETNSHLASAPFRFHARGTMLTSFVSSIVIAKQGGDANCTSTVESKRDTQRPLCREAHESPATHRAANLYQ